MLHHDSKKPVATLAFVSTFQGERDKELMDYACQVHPVENRTPQQLLTGKNYI